MADYTSSEIEAALEGCAREPVHSPNAIQPNGCPVSTDLFLDLDGFKQTNAPGDAGVIADKVLQAFSYPFELEGEILNATFSMGISVYPTDGDSFRKLMHHADMAMYQVKNQGRNAYRFHSDPG